MAAEVNKPNFQYVWASGGAKVAPSDVKIQDGWTPEVPPFQWENYLQNRQDEAILHLFQKGISEWDALSNYYFTANGTRSYVQGSDGNIYVALQDSVGQDPTTAASSYWKNALSGSGYYAVSGGTANALTATFPSTIPTLASITGIPLKVKATSLNTGAATLAVNGLAATAIVNPVGTALVQGQLPANAIATVIYDGTNFQLQTVQTGFGPHTAVGFASGTTAWVCPAGVYFVRCRMWAAGGTGAAGNGSTGGGGGGAGGFAEGWCPVVPGTSYNVVVGIAGTPPATSGANGISGGLSSFGAFMTATGGAGGFGSAAGGAGGAGGGTSGSVIFFSATGNAGVAGGAGIGGAGGGAFGSTGGGTSTTFGGPAQGVGSGGSGGNAASAGNGLAANGHVTLEY